MGLAAHSNKIPRMPQFTATGGIHRELLIGTKKPAGWAGMRGEPGRAQSGIVRVDAVWVSGLWFTCIRQLGNTYEW